MKNLEYLEEDIIIDGSPLNRLQVYMLVERKSEDLKNGIIHDSKNNMKKGRPCIVIQEGEIGKFYGNTKLIVIPLSKIKKRKNRSSKISKNTRNYTMDFLSAFVVEVLAPKASNCLVYNYVTRVESELKKWYTKDTKEEVFISEEDKVKILRVLEAYLMETVNIELKAFGRKTIYQELKESYEAAKISSKNLETSNKELRHEVNNLEASNKDLRASNKDLETSNKGLEASNKELRYEVNELKVEMEKLFKLVEEKLG